jgi:hypothetical protein
MQPRYLRAASFLSLAACVISVAAGIACLCVVLQSADAERLYRTWQFSRLLFFSSLCLFLAMGFALEAISRRVPPARSVTVSRTPRRISVVLFICAISVVLLYPARPFVYLENGHWINRSKAGTWEVSRATAIDSYKHNIVWECMLVLCIGVGLGSAAVPLSRRANPPKPE